MYFNLLQSQPPTGDPSAGGGNLTTMMILMGGIFIIFYFLIIRPQNRKQKELKKKIEQLAKGDRVVTIGGIYGTIVGIKDNILVLKIDENTKIEIIKTAVQSVVAADSAV